MNSKIIFPMSGQPSPEEKRAFQWLNLEYAGQAEAVQAADLIDTKDVLGECALIWWHSDIGIDWKASESAQMADLHMNYLRRGGRILFTGMAAVYQHRFGLESQAPNHLLRAAWTSQSGERHIKGIMGYHDHPIFQPFFGGVYTWAPEPEEEYVEVAYTGTSSPDHSEVLGVDRFYIGFDSQKRIAWQRKLEKGYLLTIGCNIKFDSRNDFYSAHLRRFISGCLDYLQSDHYCSSKYRYWTFRKYGIREKRVPDDIKSSLPIPKLRNIDKIEEIEVSNPHDNGFWDLAGRLVLITGLESHGIREIWTHPFRSFHSIVWQLSGQEPVAANKTYVRPDRMRREFKLGTVTITEDVHFFLDQPAALLVLHCDQEHFIPVEMNVWSDLRLMWPYDAGTPGRLNATIGKFSVIITNEHENSTAILWSSQKFAKIKTSDRSSDEYSNMELHLEVAVSRSQPLVILFHGSSNEPSKAIIEAETLGHSLDQQLLQVQKHLSNKMQYGGLAITPDADINRALRWSIVKLCAFDIRVPGIGNGLAAGYGNTGEGWLTSRPGYAWFFGRDSIWCCLALLHLGEFAIVRNVLEILSRYQEFTGKIFHELSTSGVVHYDAADSTPLFIYLTGVYLQHTGDNKFIEKIWPNIQRAFEFCMTTDRDNDGFIENTGVGHGWIEGGKIFGAHVTTYLAAVWIAALKQYAGIAGLMGESEISQTYEKKTEELKQDFNRRFWDEDTGHIVYGLDNQGNRLDSLCIMPAVAILLDVPEVETSIRTLSKIDTVEFSTDWGVRMISRENPVYNPRGYHYGSVWPLYTGWVALADFHTGRTLQAILHWMHQVPHDLYFAKGCVPEVLDGDTYSFAGVCLHQAWSEAMVVLPFYQGLLGLRPNAIRNYLEMCPQLPGNWSNLTIERLIFGASIYSFSYRRERGEAVYDWNLIEGAPFKICFRCSAGPGSQIIAILEDNQEILPDSLPDSVLKFEMSGPKTVRVRYGRIVRFVPLVYSPEPGASSVGYTVVEETSDMGIYRVLLHGLPRSGYSGTLQTYGLNSCQITGAEVTGKVGNDYKLEFSIGDKNRGYHEIRVEYI